MGVWGAGLYQDDVALDIKEQYVEVLREGKNKEEASLEVIEICIDYFQDADDMIPAILTLADMEWKYGKLMPDVKESALELIESGTALKPFEDNKREYKKRIEVLQKLKEKLEGPQPPEKKIRIPRPYKCQWKIGDTFAYKLDGEAAEEKGWNGEYAIIIKVDNIVYDKTYTIPEVWIKITQNKKLPETEEEINKLPFLISDVCTYGQYLSDNYWKTKNYKIDLQLFHDHEFLLSYRWGIFNSSKRIIPKELKLLGNFQHIIPPKNEYLLNNKIRRILYWHIFPADLNIGIFYDKIGNYRFRPCYNLDYEVNRMKINRVLKEAGKDFQEYLKYLDENGIKY